MKKILSHSFALVCFLVSTLGSAQSNTPKEDFTDYKVNILFGVNQPLFGGFNSEVNVFYKRLALDYSHGISLNFDNEILHEDYQAQNIDVHIPWTTGFGAGYRFNEWLNVRAEPKWHKFELYEKGVSQTESNLLASYQTFTMGIGAYANFQPFKRQENFLSGIMVAPSIRWWPRVTSSLEGNEISFENPSSDEIIQHEAMEVGVNNTPLILNVSVGYSFGWND